MPADGRPAAQAAATPDQVVAALKQNLAESQKRLRQYQWIETTAISLKGEEKSRKQQRVYYGADGKLTKLPIGEPQPQAARRRRAVAAGASRSNRREQEGRDAGVHGKGRQPDPSVRPAQPRADPAGQGRRQRPAASAAGGKGRIELRNFVQPSDLLAIDVDAKASNLRAQRRDVSREAEDAVMLAVGFASLPDGTSYVAQTTLDAKAKNIPVVVENSGYRPLAR